MRSKAILIFVLVLFVIISVVFVGKSSTIFEGDDYHDIIVTFFSQISIGEVDKAIELLYISNPWILYKTDDIKQIKSKLTNLTDLVGEYQGNELLTEYVVAKRYAYLYYFVAYDRQPIKFVFEFYKPKDKWMIYSFSFNAEMTDEIEQGIKATMFRDVMNQKKL
jgi:hypothetical protein